MQHLASLFARQVAPRRECLARSLYRNVYVRKRRLGHSPDHFVRFRRISHFGSGLSVMREPAMSSGYAAPNPRLARAKAACIRSRASGSKKAAGAAFRKVRPVADRTFAAIGPRSGGR